MPRKFKRWQTSGTTANQDDDIDFRKGVLSARFYVSLEINTRRPCRANGFRLGAGLSHRYCGLGKKANPNCFVWSKQGTYPLGTFRIGLVTTPLGWAVKLMSGANRYGCLDDWLVSHLLTFWVRRVCDTVFTCRETVIEGAFGGHSDASGRVSVELHDRGSSRSRCHARADVQGSHPNYCSTALMDGDRSARSCTTVGGQLQTQV